MTTITNESTKNGRGKLYNTFVLIRKNCAV